MKIEVSNCHECPFVEYSDKYGCYGCNMNGQIEQDNFGYNEKTGEVVQIEKMPKDMVHRLCPLKQSSVLVKLK